MAAARDSSSKSHAIVMRISALPSLIDHQQGHDRHRAAVPLSEFGFKTLCRQVEEEEDDKQQQQQQQQEQEQHEQQQQQEQKRAFGSKLWNSSTKRLVSGAIAGAVSRSAVAPLETIRTHLMVGSIAGEASVLKVFEHIVSDEGWQGLFRGNGINVLRVAPSKAIELFAYDTVKKLLAPAASRLPVPVSSVAGATAGVCSTLCTYPLELLKTRVTVQRGLYNGLFHAFLKICKEEGPKELYRGLTPSLIGVVPYAAINYLAYERLKKAYRRMTKQEKIGNLATLFIGSAAGALASASTFPLEVARKQMQVGAVSGRQVYRDVFHAISSILQTQGPKGLYRGLGPSCIKLIPAAGISFMCYEACKRFLVEEEEAAAAAAAANTPVAVVTFAKR